MKSPLPQLIAATALLLLAACNFTLPPISSAVMEHHSSGSPIYKVELNQSQANALSGWFSQHSSGWSSSVVSYVPALVVRVKHSNGDISAVNIFGNYVVVYNSSGQFTQQFAESDLSGLRRILEAR
jgi:hypothetical protein